MYGPSLTALALHTAAPPPGFMFSSFSRMAPLNFAFQALHCAHISCICCGEGWKVPSAMPACGASGNVRYIIRNLFVDMLFSGVSHAGLAGSRLDDAAGSRNWTRAALFG